MYTRLLNSARQAFPYVKTYLGLVKKGAPRHGLKVVHGHNSYYEYPKNSHSPQKFIKPAVQGAVAASAISYGCNRLNNEHGKTELGSGWVQYLRGVDDSLPQNQYLSKVLNFAAKGAVLAPFCKGIKINPISCGLFFLAARHLGWPSKAVDQHLTAPVNAIKECKFNQAEFVQLVRENYPQAEWEYKGFCQGLVMTWYAYQCIGRDLMIELDKMRNAMKADKHLTKNQIKILERINDAQSGVFSVPVRPFVKDIPNQQSAAMFKFTEFKFTDKELRIVARNTPQSVRHSKEEHSSTDTYEAVAKTLIDMALTNKGSLIRIALGMKHSLGVVAIQAGDKVEIKYFDSNFREASFADRAAAEASLVNLIWYGYRKRLLREYPQYAITAFDARERNVKYEGGIWVPTVAKENQATQQHEPEAAPVTKLNGK